MRAGDWDTARAGVALSETAEAARTRPSEPSEDVGRNLLPRTSAWRVRFKPIAREASPYVLPQPLRTTHEGTGASRAHATTRASITPPNAARDARDLVSPGVVSRLGTSRVFLGSFSRLLAGGRIRGLLDESIDAAPNPRVLSASAKCPEIGSRGPKPSPLSSLAREGLEIALRRSRAVRPTLERSARFGPVSRPPPPAADPPR
jgi:hypothetical protein